MDVLTLVQDAARTIYRCPVAPTFFLNSVTLQKLNASLFQPYSSASASLAVHHHHMPNFTSTMGDILSQNLQAETDMADLHTGNREAVLLLP